MAPSRTDTLTGIIFFGSQLAGDRILSMVVAGDHEVTETTAVKLRGDEISVALPSRSASGSSGFRFARSVRKRKRVKFPQPRRFGRRYIYLIEDLKRMVENATRPG